MSLLSVNLRVSEDEDFQPFAAVGKDGCVYVSLTASLPNAHVAMVLDSPSHLDRLIAALQRAQQEAAALTAGGAR